MEIEGAIVNVMESWPLQLTVATTGGRCHVQLLEGTGLTRQGRPVDAGELQPGQRVRVTGPDSAAGSAAVTAQSIEILG